MSTTAAAEQEELLLSRLQSQFGDMDLTHLLQEQADEKDNSVDQEEDDGDDESDESSLEEPSPEELRAWQEAQFRKGQVKVDAKKDVTKSAVQKRREELQKHKPTTGTAQQYDTPQEDDWEPLPSLPNLQGQPSYFFPITVHGAEIVGVHPLLPQLAAADEILGTAWQRLYSSAHGDGLSLANLYQKLLGYTGPTLLLLQGVASVSQTLNNTPSSATTTIGFFATSSWTDHDQSSDCFLFAFDDQEEEIKFFRPRNKQTNTSEQYIRCHPPNQQGMECGLYIGGSSSQPRLFLTETLQDCRAMNYCPQFEPGDVLLGHAQESLNYFDVVQMEVWAVGGDQWIQESLTTQQTHRDVSEANRIKAQTVDKHQLLQDLQGGLLSANMKPGGMFAHLAFDTDRCDM